MGAYPDFQTLEDRYSRIFDECMAMAECWRVDVQTKFSDIPFKADQHRRCLLRAARYARLAHVSRASSMSITDMLEARKPQP